LQTQTPWDLIQKNHIAGGSSLVFGVHHHAVPTAQGDGGVVAVRHCAASVHSRVAVHGTPGKACGFGILGNQRFVLCLEQAQRILGANTNQLATRAVGILEPVRLATSSRNWFLVQHKLFGNHQTRFGNKKPFALADKVGVLAVEQELVWCASMTQFGGLQGIHRGQYGADALPRNGASKPVALIVTAQELVLAVVLPCQQQQMPQLGLEIQHLEFWWVGMWNVQLKKFAVLVVCNVNAKVSSYGLAALPEANYLVWNGVDFHSSANSLEFLQQVGVHRLPFLEIKVVCRICRVLKQMICQCAFLRHGESFLPKLKTCGGSDGNRTRIA
jgi:hypothetical protein